MDMVVLDSLRNRSYTIENLRVSDNVFEFDIIDEVQYAINDKYNTLIYIIPDNMPEYIYEDIQQNVSMDTTDVKIAANRYNTLKANHNILGFEHLNAQVITYHNPMNTIAIYSQIAPGTRNILAVKCNMHELEHKHIVKDMICFSGIVGIDETVLTIAKIHKIYKSALKNNTSYHIEDHDRSTYHIRETREFIYVAYAEPKPLLLFKDGYMYNPYDTEIHIHILREIYRKFKISTNIKEILAGRNNIKSKEVNSVIDTVQSIEFTNGDIIVDEMLNIKTIITHKDHTIFKIVNEHQKYGRGICLNNLPIIDNILSGNLTYIHRIIIDKLDVRVCDTDYRIDGAILAQPNPSDDNICARYSTVDNTIYAILKVVDGRVLLRFYDNGDDILDIRDFNISIIADNTMDVDHLRHVNIS